MNDFRRMSAPLPGEATEDFRSRLAHQQAELAERKQHDLAEQTSAMNTPEARIRIWERRHEISLPRDAKHRLLPIIAANTGLTIEQVRDEQRQRLAPLIAEVPPDSSTSLSAET